MISDESQSSVLVRNANEKYQAGDFTTAIQVNYQHRVGFLKLRIDLGAL